MRTNILTVEKWVFLGAVILTVVVVVSTRKREGIQPEPRPSPSRGEKAQLVTTPSSERTEGRKQSVALSAIVGPVENTNAVATTQSPKENGIDQLLAEMSKTEDKRRFAELSNSINAYDLASDPMPLIRRIGLRRDYDLENIVKQKLISESSPQVILGLITWAEQNGNDVLISKEVGRTMECMSKESNLDALLKGLDSTNLCVSCGAAAALANIGTDRVRTELQKRQGQSGEKDEVVAEALRRMPSKAP